MIKVLIISAIVYLITKTISEVIYTYKTYLVKRTSFTDLVFGDMIPPEEEEEESIIDKLLDTPEKLERNNQLNAIGFYLQKTTSSIHNGIYKRNGEEENQGLSTALLTTTKSEFERILKNNEE